MAEFELDSQFLDFTQMLQQLGFDEGQRRRRHGSLMQADADPAVGNDGIGVRVRLADFRLRKSQPHVEFQRGLDVRRRDGILEESS